MPTPVGWVFLWYARHDLPLWGINFEPYRAIKCPPRWGGYFYGTPDTIRTCDLQSRSLSLYPAELRAHVAFQNAKLL